MLNENEKKEITSDVKSAFEKAKKKKVNIKYLLISIVLIVLISLLVVYLYCKNNPSMIFIKGIDTAFDIIDDSILDIDKGNININNKYNVGFEKDDDIITLIFNNKYYTVIDYNTNKNWFYFQSLEEMEDTIKSEAKNRKITKTKENIEIDGKKYNAIKTSLNVSNYIITIYSTNAGKFLKMQIDDNLEVIYDSTIKYTVDENILTIKNNTIVFNDKLNMVITENDNDINIYDLEKISVEEFMKKMGL